LPVNKINIVLPSRFNSKITITIKFIQEMIRILQLNIDLNRLFFGDFLTDQVHNT